MDVDTVKPTTSTAPNEKQLTSRPPTSRARAAALPEVDLYIHLIVLLYLIDRNSLNSVCIFLTKFNYRNKSQNFCVDMIFRLWIVLND